MRSPFLRGVVSGAAAGLLAATVAFVVLEPVLREAIALEGGDDDGLVSRAVQERLGAPLGFVLVGIAFGLVLAAVDRAVRPGGGPWRRSLVLTAALFAAVVAFPQLRYPSNPPGVGDPDTVGDRTWGYLAAIAAGILIVCLIGFAARQLAAAGRLDPARQVLLLFGGLALALVCWALLPGTAEPADVPAELLWDFRIRSLGITTLLWATLGVTYGALALRQSARKPEPAAV
ncbi:MAG TPA: CbtA family protein [Mycobacteriales bacterium]|nr:CbtA family protein [Mycobacteriales bacterium]